MATAAVQPSPIARARQPLVVGTIVPCPDCDQLAEVVDTWVWPSTAGPIAHVRTRCLTGHVFTLPTDWITART
jgi:hypothetical protein